MELGLVTGSVFSPNISGLQISKNIQSKFIKMTQEAANVLGWQSADDCVGLTDFEIPCQASQLADQFRRLDKMVFNSNQDMITLEIYNSVLGRKIILVERHIKNDLDNTLMLLLQCIDVTNIYQFNPYLTLSVKDNQLEKSKDKQVIYILNKEHNPLKSHLQLTEKQEICLFLLIRGKPIKKIAKILKLSPRTIEDHIASIKEKMNCQYKSELIEKAIDMGFLYYIPQSM